MGILREFCGKITGKIRENICDHLCYNIKGKRYISPQEKGQRINVLAFFHGQKERAHYVGVFSVGEKMGRKRGGKDESQHD